VLSTHASEARLLTDGYSGRRQEDDAEQNEAAFETSLGLGDAQKKVDDGDLHEEVFGDVLVLDEGGDHAVTDFHDGVPWQCRLSDRYETAADQQSDGRNRWRGE
jgi:hypothetical protein